MRAYLSQNGLSERAASLKGCPIVVPPVGRDNALGLVDYVPRPERAAQTVPDPGMPCQGERSITHRPRALPSATMGWPFRPSVGPGFPDNAQRPTGHALEACS